VPPDPHKSWSWKLHICKPTSSECTAFRRQILTEKITRRRIVLPNGLTALLISDPEMADAVAENGAAADAEEGADSASEEGSDEVKQDAERIHAAECGRRTNAGRPACIRHT